MKIQYQSPHAGQSGTTKNNAYAYFNRGGRTFARSQPAPAKTPTAQQTNIRNIIANVSQTWKTLTPPQRQTWQDYVQIHNPPQNPNRTAIDQYMLCNINRRILHLPFLVEAPIATPPPGPKSLTIVPSPLSTVTFFLTHPIATSQLNRYVILVKQTPPTASPGRAPRPNDAVLIQGVTRNSSAPLQPSGPTATYTFTDVRHPIATDQRFGLSIQIIEIATGLASERLFKDCLKPE